MTPSEPPHPEGAEQTSLVRPLAVVAFGGNALIQARDLGTVEEQSRRAEEAARWLVEICAAGKDLLIVHGNGPQVGQVLIQMEKGATMVPPGTMDLAVAETQGSVGYLLDLALRNRLAAAGMDRKVATVISLMVVDADDPGFAEPTKPVGPFFSEYQAVRMRRQNGWRMMEDAGRGWRKVVASPRPLEMLGLGTVADLLARNHVVIAGGGGGIPVVPLPDGGHRGVEAVIDKDRTAAILGTRLKAEVMVIVTDVPEVYRNYGKRSQRAIRRIRVKQARRLLDSGHFPPGSMGPKIESAADFVDASGGRAIITNAASLRRAIEGEAGTTVVP
ncbi:MAG: carbamate kinase [Thermoanaerobaculia bacterium]|nr:carbamate kinase [Thermoanaerobaculia bacterium]